MELPLSWLLELFTVAVQVLCSSMQYGSLASANKMLKEPFLDPDLDPEPPRLLPPAVGNCQPRWSTTNYEPPRLNSSDLEANQDKQ